MSAVWKSLRPSHEFYYELVFSMESRGNICITFIVMVLCLLAGAFENCLRKRTDAGVHGRLAGAVPLLTDWR